MREFLKSFQCNELVCLLLIWGIATSLNLPKAVHMDDPVHLYAARAIVSNPFRPYDTEILWGDVNPHEISKITQPPMLFYGLAATIWAFGESEIALHGLMALFMLGLVFCFHRLAVLFDPSKAILATALLVLSPAVLPSQNLMTDVPVMFFHVLFLYTILRRWERPLRTMQLLAAGAVAGAACLTKYVGLILIPLLGIAVLLRRSWRHLWVLAFPLAILACWAAFSYWDSGHVHLAQPAIKTIGKRYFENSINWLVCLGALTPFSLLFLPELLAARPTRILLMILVGASLFWYPTLLNQPTPDSRNLTIAARILFFNGLFSSLGTLWCLTKTIREQSSHATSINAARTLAALWFISSFLFIILFARYLAVRHVLLVMPVVVLALADGTLSRVSTYARTAALVPTMLLGVLLAFSDLTWADIYRSSAKTIAERYQGDRSIWTVGHWGWQWYSEKNGLKPYTWRSSVKNGDLIVVPELVHRHEIRPNHLLKMVQVGELSVPSSPATWLRTMSVNPTGGFYASNGNSLPFRLSRQPLERLSVFEVRKKIQKKLKLPHTVDLAVSLPSDAILQGFHSAESWGRWSAKRRSGIGFSGLLPRQFKLLIRARPFPTNKGRPIKLKVGSFETSFELNQTPQEIVIDVSNQAEARTIMFQTAYRSSAKELSKGADNRRIGFGLEKLVIIPIADADLR